MEVQNNMMTLCYTTMWR